MLQANNFLRSDCGDVVREFFVCSTQRCIVNPQICTFISLIFFIWEIQVIPCIDFGEGGVADRFIDYKPMIIIAGWVQGEELAFSRDCYHAVANEYAHAYWEKSFSRVALEEGNAG